MKLNIVVNICKKIILLGVFITLFVRPVLAGEEELPLWELGVGFGGFTLPQYMGADERYSLPFAFPYVIYRGERWKIDRSGVRNRLFDSDDLSLDISLSGGLPVRNDNQARQGMPELNLTGELGPKINWFLSESNQDSWSLHFPLRAAINIKSTYVGWVSDPHLNYSFHTPFNDGILRAGVDVGFQYNSTRYNHIYYSVNPIYTNIDRAEFQAKSGLHSVFLKARLRYPIKRETEFFISLQARSLAMGVVKDSPLVKNSMYATVALGVVWVFSVSDDRGLRSH